MLIVDTFLWLVIYSVVGWMYESTLCSVQERKLVNRGFLNGPLCPVYGIGAITVLVGIGRLQGNLPLLFLTGVILTCVVEYATAWLLETLFDTKWWDYSHMRFNLHGRICLLGAVVFGLFSVVLVEWIHPFVRNLTGGMEPGTRLLLATLSFAAIAADTSVTVFHILRMNGRLKEIQTAFDRFTEYTASHAGELRDNLANGMKDTANGIREHIASGVKDAANDLRESFAGDMMESATEFRDNLVHSVKERTSGIRESAGNLRESANELRETFANSVRTALSERFEDSEFFNERIRSLLDMNRLQSRRLSRAFPRMHHRRYDVAWTKLKMHLQERRKDGRPVIASSESDGKDGRPVATESRVGRDDGKD